MERALDFGPKYIGSNPIRRVFLYYYIYIFLIKLYMVLNKPSKMSKIFFKKYQFI